MFLRAHKRTKNGKEHRYFTVVESERLTGVSLGLAPPALQKAG